MAATQTTISSPAGLQQLPPNTPTVVYRDGLLTVSAHNCTLGDILEEVRKVTGAEIDVPPQAEERVVVNLGPGPARDVVDALLQGSRFNYALAGSEANPKALSRVLLWLKPVPSEPLVETAAAGQESAAGDAERPVIAEMVQQQDYPQESGQQVRVWQQMLQQRRQSLIGELQQHRDPQ